LSYDLFLKLENLMWLAAAERAERDDHLASQKEVDDLR
jgi:hypothetical protein